jgi:hypothetical protein
LHFLHSILVFESRSYANDEEDRIWPAMATKYGYSSKEEFVAGAQKIFSLLESGILELQSTRLLLVNESCLFLLGVLTDGMDV